MKKKLSKIKQKLKYVSLMFSIALMQTLPVLADEKKESEKPVIVSGTINLINDAIKYLQFLIAGVALLCLLLTGFKWYGSAPEEKPKYVKDAKLIAVVAVALECAGGIISWVLSYYQ